SPEAINLAIAENALKQYALREIFSKEVSTAHLKGALHLHDLGYPIRVYCSAHSLEFIKKYGLRLINLSTASTPAKHAHTLTGHLNTFLASMQAYYAGALGISFVNVFYAPYFVGADYKEMRQQAQYLIFSCSQNAFSRGGQSLVPEETIWVKEGEKLKQAGIGELVDEFIELDERKEELIDGTEISRNNFKGIEAISFDEKGKIRCKKISAFARIPFKGKIYSITTNKGEVKGVTGSHSVFVWNGRKFEAKKAEELRRNDYIVTALKAKGLVGERNELDLIEFYLNRKEAENEVRVYDTEERFKKALMERYGRSFYKEFEKDTGVKAECVRSNWLRYKKIPLKYYFEFVGNPEEEKLIYKGDSQTVFPARSKVTKSLVKLLGYYVSEGHNSLRSRSFIAVSNKEEKFIESVKECLNELSYHYIVNENKRNGVKTVVIQGILAKIISDLGEEENGVKKIPFIIYNASKELQKEFLNAFHEGDGLKRRNSYAIANTSENVVNGISLLMAMNEKDFHLFKRTYANEKWKPCYELRESLMDNRVIDHKISRELIGRKGFRKELKNLSADIESKGGTKTQQIQLLQMLMEAEVGFARIKEINTCDYEGFVYDVSVPGNESFLGGTGLIFFHNTLFIDFNIHLGIPEFLKKVPAIGPGGKYTGKTYEEYEKEAQLFAKALMDVWREGDGDGKPFPFPKLDLHVNQESFDDPRQFELLKYACLISSENGAPYFAFDRDAVNLSMCCRLRTKLTDTYVLEHPESIRYCGFQNVTINLPQAAYRGGKGNIEKCIEEVRNTMDLAMKAHLEKKEFISTLMKENGPLWQVGKVSPDGIPYLDLDKATYIIGLIGLNECVKHLIGKELHESDEAFKLGLKIISAMNLKTKELEKETGLRVALEESPAESASLRLARVDLKEFPESKEYVRGNKETREVYYTNSIHLTPDAPVSISERIEKQGKFNPLIESGAITHVFLGEQRPEPEAILNLVKKTWENTQSDQIVISPEFTVCDDCNRVSPGYKRKNLGGNRNERKRS
ncbi:hypothetical protein KJ660_04120, partial [Candidatus Micrarchaeota archaeon]|nr:hypothetical protein [Candidatus Micrarchaeota archaeon]